MKTPFCLRHSSFVIRDSLSLRLALPLAALLLSGLAVGAVTFTNDTAIGVYNTNYDGMDIAVTNCTLTVDGQHAFASLQLLSGGNLTHTFSSNGQLQEFFTATNEPQVLSVSNVATLSNASVVAASIVVEDFSGLITYTNGLDYLVGTDGNGMTTLLLTTNSAIAEGSTNLVTYSYLGSPVAAGLFLTVTGDVTVAVGGMINTDARGYGGGMGFASGAGSLSGSPVSGSGAGHGGYGGQNAALRAGGSPYDVLQQPTKLGSGGGSGYGGLGGAGGGSIRLSVGGTLRVDGTVSANGGNGINDRSGGGAGGSIFLTAQTFAGSGLLSANGGVGEPSAGGGGGGGCISIWYGATSFSGPTIAYGGGGYDRGGAGTIYTRVNTQPAGNVLVDNGGRTGASTGLLPSPLESFDLTAQGGAVVSPTSSQSLGNLLVASNGSISLPGYGAPAITFTVNNNATIQAGGVITGDGTGYPGGYGTGAGRGAYSSYGYVGGGGGYGGYGATVLSPSSDVAYGGSTYGSVTAPTDLGSGGGNYSSYATGGAGGGAVRMNVTGVLQVDGRISANGNMGLTEGGGGGSGGSVWLTVGTLTGAGTIAANGGMGNGSGLAAGGGGSGGRIAIQYGMNLFFGTTSARGGGGAATGGAGTIYTKANSASWGLVLADNGGQTGTNTTLGSTSPGTVDLTVQGGAVVFPPTSQTIGTLLVASNGWLSISSQTLTVTGNATVQPGGGIIADATGYPSGTGSGPGQYLSTSSSVIGGGAGYGGYGAAGGAPVSLAGGGAAYGGSTYGSVTAPTLMGSGGGGNSYAPGGAGGGAIRLNVTGILEVDGRISAAGGAGLNASSGGGSGGSIYLTVGTLAGSGVISANGGMGNYLGGGGGGGRIAIVYAVYDFLGLTSAYGGSGYATGGAGTVSLIANQSSPLVVVDNGGQAGTNTSWSSTSTMSLTVQGGAVVSLPSAQTIGTLLVASNGWLTIANQTLTVTGNATVQAGGGIIADATGNAAGLGSGAGRYTSASSGYFGGGGGYGGYGAAAGAPAGYSASGGSTYGYLTTPTDLGSGGGGSPYAIGGAGGGAIRLTVTGALEVDGRISAAGGAGASASAGGGSGGSIYLTVGTLAGSGAISANGGRGNALGGGGGGGRIAIVYGVNDFAGLISAYGGGGYAPGGAGTVYTAANSGYTPSLVVVDNGGQAGTNTSWSQTSTVSLTVQGGAVVSPPSGQTIGTLLVASNGWLSLSSQTLTVTGSATVQAGGGIIADGTGYAGGSGTGEGGYSGYSPGGGGGGGYGGYGAAGTAASGFSSSGGATYGSATSPNNFGSGGGGSYSGPAGGSGGGAILLTVSGALEVDGRISARGLPGSGANAGGGSGGSINLSVGTLAGAGVISANGGAGIAAGGGGGGGRIAIVYNVANAFSGLMSAYGGNGYGIGGAGTIYLKPYSSVQGSPLVLVDNGGMGGTNSGWPSGGGTFDVTVRNGASLGMSSSSQTISGNLIVGSNGWIYVSGAAGIGSPTLYVTGNATIQAGGGIIADSGGYSSSNGGTGPGAGGYSSTQIGYVGSGGGFGGCGGASGASPSVAGGNSVGYVTAGGPGSAGGTYSTLLIGGPGGGAINLNVTGTLEVAGRISSAGGAGLSSNAGGGSGGGIALTVGTLVGSGVIAANGGAGDGWGGGGGGRIVITYNTSDFVGVMSAYGGGGYTWGGAGTIYTKANKSSWGQVLADNGGQAGANTSWAPSGTVDLTVTGGAVVSPQSSLTFGNLLVNSNAWLSVSNQALTVISNVTVQVGGGIIADGAGSGPGVGQGAGRAISTPSGDVGGGGGYGGYGAAGNAPAGYSALGGSPFGSVTAPTAFGGAGGAYITVPGVRPGSIGGGALRINVTGALLVNGRISANGAAGLTQGAGGGAGGSVWLTTGTLAGTGTISANGGTGNDLGGGGSGGCVSVQYSANTFEGIISAYGGGGGAWGGAGTVYTKATSQVTGSVVVDNGGNSGTNTPVPSLPTLPAFDLTVRGGAIANPSASFLVLSNLYINSSGILTCLATQTNLDVTVLRNATIDSSSLMAVDAKGFSGGAGPGHGTTVNYMGSGAGYGGNGGPSTSAPGGVTYGSLQQPIDRGSGGGLGLAGSATGGSEGGGAIRLTVGGALTLNGRLSAEGDVGLQDDAGGGSGGSVWLTTGALAGVGTIAADGGAGELYDGGDGGGGRIAIYTPLNMLSGAVSAAGGTGASAGQTGTVYYAGSPAAPQVVSFAPSGILTAAVSSADIVFGTPVNPYSVGPNVSLAAPGNLTVGSLSATSLSPYHFQITFPAQTAPGTYVLTVGPQVVDLYGQPMSSAYSGTFTIAWATVQGSVTDTNGVAVPGVLLQPDGGVPPTTTGTNGNYVLGMPPAGTVHVVPSLAGLAFVPSSRTYTGVTSPIMNQNYLAVSTVAPALTTQVQTNTFMLNWYGISGVTYQPLYSTNLEDWVPYDGTLSGTNGPLQLVVPMDAGPAMFFRMGASY